MHSHRDDGNEKTALRVRLTNCVFQLTQKATFYPPHLKNVWFKEKLCRLTSNLISFGSCAAPY